MPKPEGNKTDLSKSTISEAEEGSTIDKIYNKIDDLFGTTSSSQMFTMMMPGTELNPENFRYDTRFEKPIKVAANESRIANKLFSPAKVVGADNGRLLANQYVSALDVLTPKINNNLINAKNKLRELLRSEVQYINDEGVTLTLNLQQLFYMLYEEYVDEKKKWADAQNAQRQHLKEVYPLDDAESRLKREEEFLNWYQTVAEGYLLKIEACHGKVLGIFSDKDMRIIEGVLDSGSGAELQEARDRVRNARKYDPNGGYVYPVVMEPSDWFEDLDSKFSFVDLLKSSEFYQGEVKRLRNKRDSLLQQIITFEVMDQSSQIGQRVSACKSAKEALAKQEKELDDRYGAGFCSTLNFINGIIDSASKKTAQERAKGVTANFEEANFVKEMSMLEQAQNAYSQSIESVAIASKELIAAKSQDYTLAIKTLYQELDAVKEALKEKEQEYSNACKKEADNALAGKLLPDALENRFSDIIISSSSEDMKKSTTTSSDATQKTTGFSCLFGGYSQTNSDAHAKSQTDFSNTQFNLKIAFRAAKVNFVRDWFDPGVFVLTQEMFNTTSLKISKGTFDDRDNCIFPCFPTAMVIAKDVSITLEFSDEQSKEVQESFEHSVAKSGGFLCFKCGKAVPTSNSKTDISGKSKGFTVSIKMPGAQILGYFMEAVPADASGQLNDDKLNAYTSITEFANTYRSLLNEPMHS